MDAELKKMIDEATARKLAAHVDAKSDENVARMLGTGFALTPPAAVPAASLAPRRVQAAPASCWLALSGKPYEGKPGSDPAKVYHACRQLLAAGPAARKELTKVLARELQLPGLPAALSALVRTGAPVVVAPPKP